MNAPDHQVFLSVSVNKMKVKKQDSEESRLGVSIKYLTVSHFCFANVLINFKPIMAPEPSYFEFLKFIY